jgi:hypothetical protein
MAEQCTSLKRTDPAAYDLRRRFDIRTCNSRKIFEAALPHYTYGTSRYAKGGCTTRKKCLLSRIKRLVKTSGPKSHCLEDAIRTFVALRTDGFKPQMIWTRNTPSEVFFVSKNHKAKFHAIVRVKDPERAGKYIHIDLAEGGVVPKPKAKQNVMTARKAVAIAEMREAVSCMDVYDEVRKLQQRRRGISERTVWDGIVDLALELSAGILSYVAEYHYDAAVRYDPPGGIPFAAIYFNYARFSFVVRQNVRKAWALNQKALRKDPSLKEARVLRRDIMAYRR